MTKRPLLNLLGLFLSSILIIIALQQAASRQHEKKNGFQRIFRNPLHDPKILDLAYNSFYVAGGYGQYIYLASRTDPRFILSVKTNLSDSQFVFIELPPAEKIALAALAVQVDYPFIFMFENIMPTLLTGNLGSKKIAKFPLLYKGFFNWLPLSSQSVVFAGYDSSIHENILIKLTANDSFNRNFSYTLTKQFPGTFSVNGILNFDKKSNRIVFVYLYRNEFICLDSNLHFLYSGHTIDTNTRVKIQVAEVKKEHYSTFSTPPEEVSKKSCISGHYLFIESGLRSDNQSISDFDNHAVIDVYDLNPGIYLFSFEIPNYQGFPLKSFKIFDHLLAATFDRFLVIYQLKLPVS